MTEEKKPLPIDKIVIGFTIPIILIFFGLPRFVNWIEGSVIDNEVSTLYYNLETAKNTAVKTKHRVWVEIQGTYGYAIFEDINGNGTLDSGEPTRKVKLNPEIQFGINPEQPLQNVWGTGTVSDPIEFVKGGKKIYLKPNGKASSSGAVYFIAKKDLGSKDADIRALKIIGTKGEISVLKISPGDSPPWK
jgi:Tfp pilus assembly protein FimT